MYMHRSHPEGMKDPGNYPRGCTRRLNSGMSGVLILGKAQNNQGNISKIYFGIIFDKMQLSCDTNYYD